MDGLIKWYMNERMDEMVDEWVVLLEVFCVPLRHKK